MEPDHKEKDMQQTRGLASSAAIDKAVEEIGGTTIQVQPSAIEQHTRGEVDVQIVTAQRFKRSVKTFMDDLQTMACLNERVAESCTYVLPPRKGGDGKSIIGPSARFAELVAAAWGHLRIASMIVGEDDRFVTVRGMAWDLQRNVAFSCEVRRQITDGYGKKFKDSTIVSTTMGAVSIAMRNAVLKVVPAALWKPIWEESRQTAAGDIRSIDTNRANALAAFKKIGVDESRVFALLDVKGHEDIDLERLATLRGLMVAIKEGDTTVAEAFPSNERAERAAAAHAAMNAQPKRESIDTTAKETQQPEQQQQQSTRAAPRPDTRPHNSDDPDGLGLDLPF